MEIGIVGLGRMGLNMARRLLLAGHEPIGYDLNRKAVEELEVAGARGAESLNQMVQTLRPPRTAWVMLPAGKPTHETLTLLLDLLFPGDILIDGGNTYYKQSMEHAQSALERGIHFLDAGTSGGIWGLEQGYCLMIGGEQEPFAHVEPLLRALAPEGGYALVGPSGAGHFAKMVHNGIEYGMLQAFAEGFHLLCRSGYDMPLDRIASLWQNGSVIRCWILQLAAKALAQDPQLDSLEAYVEDSGEGRWTVQTAIEKAVPLPATTAALFARFASRDEDSFADRFVAALRREFGGHRVRERK